MPVSNRSSVRQQLAVALFATASVLAFMPHAAWAYDESSTSAFNVDAKGVAIKGYDVMAYFTAATPTLGKPEFTSTYKGATYLFSSAANRDAFKQNPARYAPQFGGFCAMGVTLDKKLDGDPTAWRVVDGNLYLNVNKDIQKKWLEDVPGNLVKATKSWTVIKDKAPKSL
jgi:YHS domain-containing protein